MFLSIIIPIYNRENTIERCLDSILCQEMNDIEIICVDDASTDGTMRILKEYQQKYSNLVVLCNDGNHGAGYSRNRGMEAATGEYIWFVDSDDYIVAGALKEAGEILTKEKVDVLCFDMLKQNGASTVASKYDVVCEGMVITGEELYACICEKGRMRACAVSQIYKRHYMKNIINRFAEGVIAEDICYSLRSLLLAEKVLYLSRVWYVYVRNVCSVTTQTAQEGNFYGCFVAYCNMFEFWQSGKWESAVSKYLVQAIGQYYALAEKHFDRRNRTAIDAFMRSRGEYIYKMYCLFEQIHCNNVYVKEISQDLIDKIQGAEAIYIYGAGAVAREFVGVIDRMEKIVRAYIVSDDVLNNPRAICGVPVKKLGEIEGNVEDSLLVIAALPRYHEEILKAVEAKGFTNVVKLLEN